MNDLPICPCEGFTHPQVIFNPPGRNTISYRVGDYTTFREALLLPLKDRNGEVVEQELINWRPSSKGDLALQMVEWWAYVTDILTFYNERIANQAYLRTADLPESLQRLIRILGYRPRPGIGAQGTVAALMSDPTKQFTLPKGFPIQSKPGPGKQPQIFELDTDTQVISPDTVAVMPPPLPSDLQDNKVKVRLKGVVTTVKVGDNLLLLGNSWTAASKDYAFASVTDVQPEKDPYGNTNTRVTLSLRQPKSLAIANVKNYRLLKSSRFSHLWQYTADPNLVIKDGTTIHLEAIARQLKVNDPVLFDGGPNSPQLFNVTSYTEIVWFANGNPLDPTQPPPPPSTPPTQPPPSVPLIPIPHTVIGIQPSLTGNWDSTSISQVLVNYAWQEVGQLIETPAQTFSTTPQALTAVSPTSFSTHSNQPILIEDTNGQGILATGSVSSDDPSSLQLTAFPNLSTPLDLKPPLQMLFNLLSVSRGQTVSNEILGSGDASIAAQEFMLQKSPLTYLLSGDSSSGNSYKSTLQVWVNGVKWKEVPSFYGQAGKALIFVTREDENNNTFVQFGDGVNGARLPSGVNNVVATYRYGSGKDTPAVGTLNVITKPYPNLKAIHNPVPVGGGADPDPPQQIRRYAPQSVLTFGRAVSGDDYETIAAQAPGVARAKADWTWDPDEQRTLVLIYVGDDASAVNSAKVALRNAADPNRPVQVKQAIAIPIKLILNLRIDSSYVTTTVVAAVMTALLDADTGLFGINAIGISQSIYQSQIYATCQSVAGVIAVHGLQFWATTGNEFILDSRYRHDPGEGKFYQLSVGNLTIAPEGT